MSDYYMITREKKQNIRFPAVPFCIEKVTVQGAQPQHIHDYTQLTIVTAGRGRLVVDGQPVEIREGDVYTVNSYSPHFLDCAGKMEVVHLMFFLDDLVKYARELRDYDGFRNFFMLQGPATGSANMLHLKYDTLVYITHISTVLLNEIARCQPGAETMVQSYFLILVTCLAREYEQDAFFEGSEGGNLYQAMLHINQNYAQPLQLEDLAKIACLSERQFRRLFTQHYGISPARYIQRLRINKACHLLRRSSYNINEIAMDTGFLDSNYFARRFKAETGLTPKQYRRQHSG